MAEHTFTATWNYCQFKQANKNLEEGDVLIVNDFAQNYLCLHQNEPQGMHWDISKSLYIQLWLILNAQTVLVENYVHMKQCMSLRI